MNREQIYGPLRAVVPALVAIAVAKGLVPGEMAGGLANDLVDGLAGVVMVGAAVWSVYKNSNTQTIDRASNAPGVLKIIATPAIADTALKSNPKVVSH